MALSKQIRLFLWIRLSCLVNVFLFLATSSLPGADTSSVKTPSSAELTRAVVQVSSLIQQGRFDAARRELQQQSFNNTLTDQLSHLLLEYESIQNKRETERRELYQQNVKELEALQAVKPDHADGAEKVLATIAHLFEYADETQKKYWRNDIFIQDVIEQAICFAAEKEAQENGDRRTRNAITGSRRSIPTTPITKPMPKR